MKYIATSYDYLEDLGFDDLCAYWQKQVEFGKYIRVYCHDYKIKFFIDDGCGNDVEFNACVPIWAFTTIVKMINNGLVD